MFNNTSKILTDKYTNIPGIWSVKNNSYEFHSNDLGEASGIKEDVRLNENGEGPERRILKDIFEYKALPLTGKY